jgi:hypothetical protein
MVALAMALVASGAWAMAMVLAMALGAMEVVAVATSIPPSMADTGPQDFTENVAICDDLLLIQSPSLKLAILTLLCYCHEDFFSLLVIYLGMLIQ